LSIIDASDDSFTNLKPVSKDLCAYEYENDQRIKRNDFICEKAFTFPAVFADGRVTVCDQDSNAQEVFGSLADGKTFKKIWFGKQASEIRRIVRDNPESLSFCSNCPFKDRSVTDCSIKRYDLQRG